jgi:hypothetical protein
MREKEFGKNGMEKPKLLGWVSIGFLLFPFHNYGFCSPISFVFFNLVVGSFFLLLVD